jgi:hypothetical protein
VHSLTPALKRTGGLTLPVCPFDSINSIREENTGAPASLRRMAGAFAATDN